MKNYENKRNRFRNTNTKALIAAALVASAIPAIPQDVEGAELYHWSKYKNKVEVREEMKEVESSRTNDVYEYRYGSSSFSTVLLEDGTLGFKEEGEQKTIAPGQHGNVAYQVYSDKWMVKHVSGGDAFTIITYDVTMEKKGYNTRGDFTETIAGTESQFTHNSINSDGFWYVRGAKINNAPTNKSTIPTQSIAGKGKSTTVNLINFFQDSDGDVLTYTVTATGSAVTATVNGSTLTLNGVSKGASQVTVTAKDPSGTSVSQTFTVNVENTAPDVPTLTVPTQQFEHGDKHNIGWTGSDVDNDSLAYTLQASYNNGAWDTIYNGPNKTYQYTVPNNKGANVKFRVIANDGQATSTSAESTQKSIREIMYYWSKFNNRVETNYTVSKQVVTTPLSGYETYYASATLYPSIDSSGGTLSLSGSPQGYEIGGTGSPMSTGRAASGYTNATGQITYNTYTPIYTDGFLSGVRVSISKVELVETKVPSGTTNSKGTLVQNNIEGGLNAYTDGARHSDGFWYERGQRVLAEDTTPPIIELTEQTNYAATSTITVKTHDLGTVQTVKWAKGNQSTAYFASAGTAIGVGQTTPSSFSVSENGVYTVYAVDNKGNATVQTIEVRNANTAPTVLAVSKTNPFDVLDANTNATINIQATDREQTSLTATVQYNGKTATGNISSSGSIQLLGSNYSNGVYDSPITATVNDGIVSSASNSLNNHIVIKVDNAADYRTNLIGHIQTPESFTKAQHQAFYNAYQAVLSYESGRTQEQYNTAVSAIESLKTATISESETITSWNERLAIVLTAVSLEKAEVSLVKQDFLNTKELFDKLTLNSNKDLITERLSDLAQYHTTSDLLIKMEDLVGDNEAFFEYVNTTSIKEIRENIALTNKSEYKKDLNNRLNKIIQHFLNKNPNLNPGDLTVGGEGTINMPDPNVPMTDEKLNGIYNDLKDAFEPLTSINPDGSLDYKNAQQLINVSTALRQVMMNLDSSSISNYKTVVSNAIANGNNVDSSKLSTVTSVIDNLYSHRMNFVEDENSVSNTSHSIDSMNTGKTYVKEYFNKMNSAIKEVSEYNTVEFDEFHNEEEKQEGQTVVSTDLWSDSKFQKDMQEYLDNGIPEVIANNGKYDYIHNGTLSIKGTVVDSNNENLEATVTIGSLTGSGSIISNNEFTIGINTPVGLIRDEVKIIIADDLTEKKVTIKGSPIVHVANVTMFTDMVKALEVDRSEDFTEMADGTINSLIEILDTVLSSDMHTSPVVIRALYNKTEALSTQANGKLESLVRSYISSNYLQWLFDNYTTATVDDFEFAGVLNEGKPVVTYENIDNMKIIISDYIDSYAPAVAPTPTVEDYIKWSNMIASLDEVNKAIDAIYDLTDLNEVATAIDKVTEKANDEIPTWSSVRPPVDVNLGNVNIYKNALEAVIAVEENFEQTTLDSAQVLVDKVADADAKQALQDRIDAVQSILDVIKDALDAVVLSEETLVKGTIEEAVENYDLAVIAVELLEEGPVKQGLQDRLDEVLNIINGRTAVEVAEDNILVGGSNDAQALLDKARDEVDLIENQLEKDSLNERLDEVQKAIDAQKAIEKAAEETANENESAIDEAIKDAQDKINLVSDPDIKESLQNSLNNLETLSEALQAVIQAEKAEEQTSSDTAQIVVNQLPESSAKDGLNERLKEVQKVIDGKKDVSTVESTLEREDYDKAVETVSNISDSKPTKKDLEEKLENILTLIEAIEAVERAEENKSQQDKDKAEELVNNLPEGELKEELTDRLQDVQDSIDKKSSEEKAEDAVKEVEKTWEEEDLTEAQDLVDSLTDEDVKEELQDRLDKVEDLMDAHKDAEQAVEKAESDKTQESLDEAQKLVDDLVLLAGGDNDKTNELQDRLDKVNDYLEAEEAVERAENLLTQGSKDQAQEKVDKLEESSEKQELQDRLDALQEKIDEKVSDILDKIIDDTENITGQELADYVKPEPVYEELMDDYKDALKDLVENNHPISKEDVVNVVRFINSLEIAKAEMTTDTLATYRAEHKVVTPLLTMNNYPDPSLLEMIEQYVGDDSILPELIDLISSETGLSQEDIENAVKEMKEEKEEVTIGSYTIKYVDELGETLHEELFKNVEFGAIEINPSLEGYEIVENSEDVYSFELNSESDKSIFTFTMKLIGEQTSGDTAGIGEYKIKYVDEEGTLVKEEIFEAPYGLVNVLPSLEGYEVIPSESDIYSIELSETTSGSVLSFTVKADETPEVKLGSYSVDYKAEDGVIVHSEDFEAPYGDVLVKSSIETVNKGELKYEIVGEEEKELELNEETIGSRLIFQVKLKENPEETLTSGDTASINYETTLVAVLNGIAFTSTNNVPSGLFVSNKHDNYLTNASFLSLVGVKAAIEKGLEEDPEFAEKIKHYISANLVDGSYKELLLSMLQISIEDLGNGNDGEPNLTQITPTPPMVKPPVEPVPPVQPPVIEPPTTNPVNPTEPPVVSPPVTNPPIDNGGGSWNPPVDNGSGIIVYPSKPSENVYPPTIDIEKGEQSIGKVESGKDGSISLTVKNPEDTEYVLESNGVYIKVTLEKDLIEDLRTLEIKWVNLGKGTFQLELYGDKKLIEEFNAELKVSNKAKYVVKNVDGYKALNYTKDGSTFKFKLKNQGKVYFHSNKSKFKDVSKFTDRKEMIEELNGRHIILGVTETKYNPNGKVTRAQLAVMIARALELEPTSESIKFSDTKGKWYEKDVQALFDAGMISGVSKDKFNGDEKLTRQQAVLMLNQIIEKYSSSEISKPSGESKFLDANKISENAKLAVERLEGSGIISGYEGYFNPQADLTRAQIAKMLHGVLVLTGNM